MKTVNWDTVLNRASYLLDTSDQWKNSNSVFGYEQATAYYYEAESLVELLEIQHCRSVGGFAPGQTKPRYGVDGLRDRIEFLASVAER